MTAETTNIWAYLMNVAPVVVVMGLAVYELWRQNKTLIEKIHERDLANLRTLEQMLAALRQIEQKGDHHFDELRKHISERVSALKADL
jgi:ABC-type nickel/cobalt efflux system permease component RcnA